MKKQLLFMLGLLLITTIAISQPTITSFTPTSGPVGTSVTITGTNFSATLANNIVFFGATRATVTAASTIQLTVTVPVGATYAPITVFNTATALLAYAKSNFTPTFSPNKGSITSTDFGLQSFPTTGANPYSVAIGDLDGDGKADLAVANLGSNTISVFRNTSSSGTISYAAKVDFMAGSSPTSIAIGDLDGDGKADMAVANQSSNTVSFFRNTGSSGIISYATRLDFVTGLTPFSVAIGDLDGDGKADLAVANYSSNTVSIFRNTGSSGMLNYAAKVDLTTGSDPLSVAVGDLDGDGKADLAVANNGSGTFSVFRNTGSSGTIGYAAKVDFATGANPWAVAIGDLDGDGKADLAAVNFSINTISVLRNTGSIGTISYAAKVDFMTGINPYSVALGDLDGDGKADLATANQNSNTFSVFRNTGSSGTISYAAKVDFPTSSFPLSVAIGDLDGDGKADLAVTNSSNSSVYVYRNVRMIDQAITFSALPVKTFGNAPFAISATASSTLPVTFTSSNASVATVSGNTVTIVGGGTATITAIQTGNTDYNSATPVDQLLTVNKANQTITFGALAPKTFGDATFNLTATSSSALAVSYVSSNTAVATVSGNTVTIVGGGTTTITAAQAGNTNYNPATNVPQNLTVNKTNQTITFTSIADKTLGGAAFTLAPTASSGLPIQYSTTSNKITITGNQITLVSAGRVIITAAQIGNGNFNAATSVDQSFCINFGTPTITLTNANTASPMLTSNAPSGNQWFRNGTLISGATNPTFNITQAGIYAVQVQVDDCISVFSNDLPMIVTDVELNEASAIEVYPNPVSEWLTVSLGDTQGNKQVSVLQINGTKIESQQVVGSEATFYVGKYAVGLYLVEVKTTQRARMIRFMKR